MTDIPTIDVFPSHLSRDGWRFWCEHCHDFHLHGGQPDANGIIGHRTAHCSNKTSPYLNGGYILRVSCT